MRLLLNFDANVNMINGKGLTSLYISCLEKHTDVVELLLDKNADVDICYENGYTPLLIACREGSDETV